MKAPLALRARAELELRKRTKDRVELAHRKAIPDDVGFREWCEDQAKKGLLIDGKPFRLDERPALSPIYEAIPTTREEAFKQTLVVQKATQLGLTVWEVLANIYLAMKFEPLTVGMFLPDQSTAAYKSEHRFMRLIRTLPPDLYKRFTHRANVETGGEKRSGEGNVLTRVMGESIFLFLWTSGKVSTESRPMDLVTLDEVQEMALDEIDKVLARMGDSLFRFAMMLSTANWPELDINYWYLLGTQEVWHTECPSCLALSDLSDPARHFPGCVAFNAGQVSGAPLNEYVYTCPECKEWIEDPQKGRYLAENPGVRNGIRSFLLPRTISPRMSAGDLIGGWNRAVTGDQKKSFYNRTLARPYVDQDQLPVSLEHCRLCAQEGARAGLKWESAGRDTYMGIDQMGGFNAVIIKRRLPDHRQAVVHVEAVFDLDPFERCAELMGLYGVAVCVVEQLPNVNDARKFMNRFPGRVFLAGYSDLKDDFMVWGDAIARTDKKTVDDERTRYTVTLNQYKCMQTTLFRIRNQHCLFPDPSGLVQDVIDKGEKKRIAIVQDWVFLHYTKTALVVEQNEQTRETRSKVKKIGLDPHYSFASMLCDVAWARAQGSGSFILPDAPVVGESPSGIPAHIRGAMEQSKPLAGEVCGRCSSFVEGLCMERGRMKVSPDDPGCMEFMARPNFV